MSVIDSRFTLETQFDVKRIEEFVRQYWREANIEGKWHEGPANAGKWFTFLEGPPTTNGFPHVGHIRGRTYKDVVLKYHRLLGYRVWAQGGWDEQGGLPVEIEVEKKLGLRTKKDIEKVGYEKFSLECNSLVDYYLERWREIGTRRLGLWLDLERAYETRRPYYIEHVWAFLKNAWKKGLLFEDYRVLPFCPRCETALSDAEVDQGYEDREDPSIFVKFPPVEEQVIPTWLFGRQRPGPLLIMRPWPLIPILTTHWLRSMLITPRSTYGSPSPPLYPS